MKKSKYILQYTDNLRKYKKKLNAVEIIDYV